MSKLSGIVVLATLVACGQTLASAAPAPAPDQQEFCALAEKLRASVTAAGESGREAALQAARSAVEGFIVAHRGIDWSGTVGRIVFSEKNKAGGEVEACPAVWVGGVSPEGGVDSETWAEPETRLYNRWRGMTQGNAVEFRAALLGVYDRAADFPAKIRLRARIVDVSPQP
jgi:hypothetical protein